jgi:hypothetical protein
MSCGVTTRITYTDDLYYSPPRVYNSYPHMYNYYNPFNPYIFPYNRQYIFTVPRQNIIMPKINIPQPRQYNFNNNSKQKSAPIRKFK